MKRTLFLLLVFVALIALYFVLGSTDKNTSVRLEDREFILESPDKVEVITIESKARPAIHLSKRKEGWFINNKHKANDRIVNNMLQTMRRMSIKYVPPLSEHQTAVERMAMHGLDITTFDSKGRVITDFILGTNTNDEYGTYCMMPQASQSYVMSIPSIQGGIRNYFTQSQEEMRENTVFSYEPNNIRKVSITYPKSKQHNFSISRQGKSFDLQSSTNSGEPIDNIMDAYIKDFKNMYCEYVKNDHELKDSIISIIPFAEMKIEAQNKPPLTLKVFPTLDLTDTSVNTRSPDDISEFHQKFFVYSNFGDFYFVQDKFVHPYFKKPSYFYKK